MPAPKKPYRPAKPESGTYKAYKGGYQGKPKSDKPAGFSETGGDAKPYKKPYAGKTNSDSAGEEKPFKKAFTPKKRGEKQYIPKKEVQGPRGEGSTEKKPRKRYEDKDKPKSSNKRLGKSKPATAYIKKEGDAEKADKKPRGIKDDSEWKPSGRSFSPKVKGKGRTTSSFNKRPDPKGKLRGKPLEPKAETGEDMRLNKYLAHAGVSSRRSADEIIAAGDVTVNDKVILEMGYRVQPNDLVKLKGKTIRPVRNMVYILLNKPKDYITTTNDEKDRRTVMELITKATNERVYPVGRLDRQTTGLLLLTNDGELAQQLSHPSHQMKKIYHVVLDKPVTEADLESIATGVVLEDGLAEIDAVAYADRFDKHQVGIELHVGKNRIVRRIFEHLGYQVERLDRVMYGGLTKKDLPRGRWRFLEEKEVIMLKHFSGRGR